MPGIDLKDTEVELLGVKWGLRIIPLLKYEELSDALAEKMTRYREHVRANHLSADGKLETSADCADCTRLGDEGLRASRPVYREIVRWGLAGTPSLTLETEPAELDGTRYEIPTAEMVDGLSRMLHGQLVQSLATAIMAANQLDPKEALGFK